MGESAASRVLRFMADNNLSVMFSDRRQQWIWKNDIRRDATLADVLIAEKFELRKEVR